MAGKKGLPIVLPPEKIDFLLSILHIFPPGRIEESSHPGSLFETLFKNRASNKKIVSGKPQPSQGGFFFGRDMGFRPKNNLFIIIIIIMIDDKTMPVENG
jgi:hypothetical protein